MDTRVKKIRITTLCLQSDEFDEYNAPPLEIPIDMRTLIFILTSAICALSIAQQSLEIESLEVRGPVPGQHMTAGYFQLTNNSDHSVVLVGVSASFAHHIEMHETANVNGTMQMRPVKAIEVLPGQSLEFAPGGLHLMIMGLQEHAMHSENLMMTFQFQDGSTVSSEAQLSAY